MTAPNNVMVGGVAVDTSQFDLSDHSSNVGFVRTTNIVLITLVGLFVLLRIIVRSFIVRKFFLDDILILIASAFTIAFASLCIIATHQGLGTHVWLFPFATVFDTVKWVIQFLFVCQVLYACAIAFTKVAIIASYLRFIQDPKFSLAMYATGTVILGLWITGIFVTIFQCHPVSGAWDFTNPNRKCINFVDYLYASSSISVATDIILCILPCPYLWRLNMALKQRVILCLLFAGGACACIAGILRITKLYTLHRLDVTFECVSCLNLSVIECSLGIICVSIPTLRPLAGRLFPNALRTNRSSSTESPLHTWGPGSRFSRARNDSELQSVSDAKEGQSQHSSQLEARPSIQCGSYEDRIDSGPTTPNEGTKPNG